MTSEERYQRLVGEIRAELGRRHMHQKDLAPILGLSPAAVSDRFRGVTPFPLKEVFELADEFEVPVGQLLGGPTSSWEAVMSDLQFDHAA